jgi:hypothetical protein
VAIDTRTPLSPGWWIERLARKLTDPKRQKRFKELDDWYRGVPPLPPGAENCADAFRAFQRESRTNFAELIVTAIRERMVPIGIRTSADGDETGDAEAWRMWTRAGMKKTSAEVHKAMFTLSESYVITGPVSPFTGVPTVTAEDPRQVITEHDPADDRRIVAALKLFHDDIQGRDLAYLYLPGVVLVASRETGPRASHRVQFSSQAYSWDESLSGTLPDGMMPVRRFLNEDGTGEFETHLDLLRRINTGILQRMTIAVLQAFRQRAATGLPEKDERGQVIDYTDIFAADPGALWQLPAGVEMWESGQVDLTPVLAGTKDDVQQLGAVSRTPMHMLMPDGANQTAEGANIQREGLTFKALDRIAVATEEWSGVLSDCFLWMGDEQRADLDALTVLWRPPERLSLAERADANAKLTDVPWRTRMIEVMGYTPDQVDRMETERAADQLLASALAQQTAPQPGQQGRPGQQVPEPAPTRQGAA